MKHLFKRGALATLMATGFLLGAPAQAADYPSKAISIVVGYPAGGSVDLTARVLGEALSERLGQSVVIENLGGAGGTIGAGKVARAKPDGYTLLVGATNEMVIAGMINSAVNYDGLKDFTPVGMIAAQPMMLVASRETGVETAAQYLEKLKAGKAGDYTFGSSGIGTALHLAGEMINESTGTSAAHIPYRGVAPLLTDLVSGQLNYGIFVMSSGLPHVKSGKVVALGVTEAQRSPAAPDMPALAEFPGFENVDINVWFGLYGPAGLPDDVAAKLKAALDDVLQNDDEFRKKLEASGATLYKPGMDAGKFQVAETEKYARLVKLAKIERQ
ncbi:tripartite tricarboxylate transporter substrate binding protein [Pusillimonas sp. MFBS29]|uniref:Bug family tripartite tricarboxylate transporter substrate binding protein n=1 Tax=Pusillimonas sp. MFBS29 TaxID=2886690 RepID=UPI001D0F5A99|nr:tripartite tricarboxylate transporter substrate binding protein [Pusillimonas sp. MFBS29]MCC2596067.1 tripartite tricarboxylate transporter substrate binding protein [Pusillimonas sp. MFBS29]